MSDMPLSPRLITIFKSTCLTIISIWRFALKIPALHIKSRPISMSLPPTKTVISVLPEPGRPVFVEQGPVRWIVENPPIRALLMPTFPFNVAPNNFRNNTIKLKRNT